MDMIHCSAIGAQNRGIISKEECLRCARENFPPPCNMDFALIKRLHTHGRWEPTELHVSDLIQDCLRKTWLTKYGMDAEFLHHRFIVRHGTAVHEFIESVSEGDDFYEAEKNVSIEIADGVRLYGTVDTIYPARQEGHVIIVDNKTTRNMKIKYLPKKEHELQVSLYKYMLEKAEGVVVDECYISYIDLVGPTRCERCYAYAIPSETGIICPSCLEELPKGSHLGSVLVPVNLYATDVIEELINTKGMEIVKAITNPDTLPPATTSFLCRYCPFIRGGICPEGGESLF